MKEITNLFGNNSELQELADSAECRSFSCIVENFGRQTFISTYDMINHRVAWIRRCAASVEVKYHSLVLENFC